MSTVIGKDKPVARPPVPPGPHAPRDPAISYADEKLVEMIDDIRKGRT